MCARGLPATVLRLKISRRALRLAGFAKRRPRRATTLSLSRSAALLSEEKPETTTARQQKKNREGW
jgi:hypothetical protein